MNIDTLLIINYIPALLLTNFNVLKMLMALEEHQINTAITPLVLNEVIQSKQC